MGKMSKKFEWNYRVRIESMTPEYISSRIWEPPDVYSNLWMNAMKAMGRTFSDFFHLTPRYDVDKSDVEVEN